jgi:hypothetical protein
LSNNANSEALLALISLSIFLLLVYAAGNQQNINIDNSTYRMEKNILTSNLHVSGTAIKDADDNTIILRGIFDNVSNLTSDTVTIANLQVLKSHGCNLLRFEGLPWGQFETASGVYNTTYLANIDNIVDLCSEVGIFVNIVLADFTGDDGTSAGGRGVAYPSWLTAESNAQVFETNFYDKTVAAYDAARLEFSNMLVYLANRYSDNPYFILGFENEPFNWAGDSPFNDQAKSDSFADVITDFYTAVDATDYSNIILLTNPFCNYELLNPGKPVGANLVWDVHAYWVETNPLYDSLFDWVNVVEDYGLTPYRTNLEMPLIIGEFAQVGGDYVGSTSSGFLSNTEDMVDYLNNQSIGSSWAYLGELYGWFSPIYNVENTNSLYAILFDGSTSPSGEGVDLTVNSSVGGDANYSPSTYTVQSGSQVTLQATAFTGYGFKHWDIDGSHETSVVHAFTVTEDTIITPVFTPSAVDPTDDNDLPVEGNTMTKAYVGTAQVGYSRASVYLPVFDAALDGLKTVSASAMALSNSDFENATLTHWTSGFLGVETPGSVLDTSNQRSGSQCVKIPATNGIFQERLNFKVDSISELSVYVKGEAGDEFGLVAVYIYPPYAGIDEADFDYASLVVSGSEYETFELTLTNGAGRTLRHLEIIFLGGASSYGYVNDVTLTTSQLQMSNFQTMLTKLQSQQ